MSGELYQMHTSSLFSALTGQFSDMMGECLILFNFLLHAFLSKKRKVNKKQYFNHTQYILICHIWFGNVGVGPCDGILYAKQRNVVPLQEETRSW